MRTAEPRTCCPTSARLPSRAAALLAVLCASGCGLDRSGSVDGGDDGPLPCANRIRDTNETDTDCGGFCGPCDDGARCLADGDCASGRCEDHNCAWSFSIDAPQAYMAGPFPTGVVAGDVTGDGRADLVLSLRNDLTFANPEPHLSLLVSNADGSFQPPVTFITPGFPYTLAGGDFNGDKLLDIALPDSRTDQIAIVMANGQGGFRKSYNVAASPQANAVVTGDFDGDGHLDLVAIDRPLVLLAGDGTGHFAQPGVEVLPDGTPYRAAVADFNGDKRDDLAIAGSFNVTVYLGQRGPGLKRVDVPSGLRAGALVAGDFDRDGKSDLAGSDAINDVLVVLLGNGDGTFRAAPPSADRVASNALLAAADFDGDGHLDVTAADATGRLLLFPGKGDGGFRLATEWYAGTAPVGLCTGDFNADDKADLAAANAETDDVTVLLGTGDGRFPRITPLMLPGAPPLTLLAADLNGDGRDDLLTGSVHAGLSAQLASGSSFGAPTDYWVSGLADTIAAGDLDGDGRIDVVTASREGRQVNVLRNAGDGMLKPPQSVDTSGEPTAVSIGDIDADGKPDLAVIDHADGTLRVLLARGTGFQHLDPIKAGLGAFAVAICDLDRDGRSDFVVAITGSARKSLAVIRAKGELMYYDPVTYPFGGFDSDASASVIVCRDLDGMGGPDIAVIDAGSAREQKVSILASNPDGSLRALDNHFAGAGMTSMAVTPLHTRGRLHIVVAGPRGVGLLLGNGSGSFLPALTFRVGGASFGATVGDFNGDGRTDVAAIIEGFPPSLALLMNHAP